MSIDSVALRQKRANLLNECRSIVDAAEEREQAKVKEDPNYVLKQGLSGEDETRYKGLWSEQERLEAEIKRMESLEAAERELKAPANKEHRSNPGANPSGKNPGGNENRSAALQLAEQIGLDSFRASPEYEAAYNRYLKTMDPSELRSFTVGSITQAGLLVAPVQMIQMLLKAEDNQTFIRQLATKLNVPNAMKVQIPELTDDPDEPDTVTELTIGSEDSTMAIGARYLEPHPKSKTFKLSRDIVRMALIDVAALILERLGYKFAIHQEKKFLLGTGFQEPLGVFVASSLGVPTSRDVSTGNTTTGPTFDGLKSAKFSLREAYMLKSQWCFHRDLMAYIAKIKDGDGRYQLQDSVKDGEPDMLLGRPVRLSEYAPNTNTTGQYVGLLADWSNYWIADAYNTEIQVLEELYAGTNQIAYILRQSYDGRPALAEAFARVKNA